MSIRGLLFQLFLAFHGGNALMLQYDRPVGRSCRDCSLPRRLVVEVLCVLCV